MILLYNKNKKHIILFFQVLIFLLFLYSAVSKASTFEIFVNNLDKSLFFETFNTSYLAKAVIIVEFVIPILLFFKSTEKAGYIISFLLLLLFTGYIFLMYAFSPFMPCSCGGLIGQLSWSQHIIFNIIFMIMSLYMAYQTEELI